MFSTFGSYLSIPKIGFAEERHIRELWIPNRVQLPWKVKQRPMYCVTLDLV